MMWVSGRSALEAYRDFLNNLVGRWSLTGNMGEVDLHQEVDCAWTLGNRFLWMYFKSTAPEDNPTSSYEAVYHIGFNENEDLYVMHLLDTTEVSVECVVGRGRREGHRIPFLFEYEDTDFFNVLGWEPQEEKWTFRQTFEEEVALKIFAEKEMVRVSPS